MRGDASGLEPGAPPQAFAERRELAEMRRPFDRSTLEPQFPGGGIVVNRRMRIVDLGMEHLLRPAPRPSQRIGGLGDDRVKGLHRTSSRRESDGLAWTGLARTTGRRRQAALVSARAACDPDAC